MRVVFLTHNYPRHPGDIAGAFLHPLAAALVARGDAVTVIAPADRGSAGEETRDGVVIRRVRYATPDRETLAYDGRMVERAASPGGLLALAGLHSALRRAAREELSRERTPAVLHAHWWVPAGLAAPPESPLLLTVHGTDGRLLAGRVARLAARPVFRRARVVTTVSKPLAATVRKHTGRTVPEACVLPMPVDTSGWTWSVGGGGAVLVARLTAQKRVHLAIEAVALLAQDGVTLPLTIVGDGPERPALEALTARLGMGAHVRFAGAVSPDEIPARLAQADLFVLPAREEGFGLAAVEALMAGVPIVACSDGGGLLDIVSSDGAGRIAATDPGSLAAAMSSLAADPASRDAARTEGQRWRTQLAPSTIAERFAALYAEAMGG